MADGIDYAAQRDGGTASYDVPSTGTTVDGALLIGLVTAFGLIGAAIMVGDSIRSFLDFPSVLIVLLGSVAVTLVSFSVGEMLAVVPLLLRTLFPPVRDVRRACQRALSLAEIGRRNGVLALDQVLPRLAAEPFLQRAVAMAVDGTAAEKIQRSEEHTSELQSLMRISYAVLCLKQKKKTT